MCHCYPTAEAHILAAPVQGYASSDEEEESGDDGKASCCVDLASFSEAPRLVTQQVYKLA